MRKLLLILFLGMFLLSFTSALDNLGTFKQNEQVRISQVCSDATYINISSISFPDSSIAISGVAMTSAGNGEFYYNFANTTQLGRYDVRGISDGCEKTFATYFEVTENGKSGLVFKLDDYNDLANKINILRNNKSKYLKFKKEGLKRVEDFKLNNITKIYEQKLIKLLK